MKNFQSGCYIQQKYYKSFQPNPIDRVWSLGNMELIQLLGRADSTAFAESLLSPTELPADAPLARAISRYQQSQRLG